LVGNPPLLLLYLPPGLWHHFSAKANALIFHSAVVVEVGSSTLEESTPFGLQGTLFSLLLDGLRVGMLGHLAPGGDLPGRHRSHGPGGGDRSALAHHGLHLEVTRVSSFLFPCQGLFIMSFLPLSFQTAPSSGQSHAGSRRARGPGHRLQSQRVLPLHGESENDIPLR